MSDINGALHYQSYYVLDKKKRKNRRRRWRSEPGRRFHGLPKPSTTDVSSTEDDSHDEDSPYESSSSEIDPKVINLFSLFFDNSYFLFLNLKIPLASLLFNQNRK